eukprot:SAG22_NODE_625_length_8437_cov_5.263133_4_plen_73_part_00
MWLRTPGRIEDVGIAGQDSSAGTCGCAAAGLDLRELTEQLAGAAATTNHTGSVSVAAAGGHEITVGIMPLTG